ncbi:hypothetical protein M3J09_013854 [Ascochyta lentis]
MAYKEVSGWLLRYVLGMVASRVSGGEKVWNVQADKKKRFHVTT